MMMSEHVSRQSDRLLNRRALFSLDLLERRMLLSDTPIFVASNTVGTLGEYTTSGATVSASLVPAGLDSPYGIAVSGTDLFIANAGNGTISEIDASGNLVNDSLISGLSGPFGIAISGSDLFVVNNGNGAIGEYTTSGTTVNANLVTGLGDPEGIAVVGDDLFVANGGAIGEYTTAGATVNPILVTGLNSAEGLAASGSDLFVANYGGGTIGEYTTSGATVNDSLVTGLSGPQFIAVSGSDLFIESNSGFAIGEYTTSGATISDSVVSPQGTATGLAISGADLFVADNEQNSICEYTTSGSTVNASLFSGLSSPVAIAASGSDVFVATGDGTIGEYTATGATVNASLISAGFTPDAIAVSGSSLFVVDSGQTQDFEGSVSEYTTSGALVNGNLITDVSDADGIAVSGGDLFVLGSGGIGEYTTSGATINASLVTASPDSFTGIAVSGSDLFVTNPNTSAISEYTTSGTLVNAALLPLQGPIAVSDSNLFVANTQAGTIGEYTISGATVNAALITGLDEPQEIALPAAASTADQLVFANSPANPTAPGSLGTITVDVEDPNGSLLTTDDSDVTLTLSGGNGDATLGGTTTVAAVNGVASFSDLSITTPGTAYLLAATDGTDTSATSSPFDIVAPAPVSALVPTLGNVKLASSVVVGAKLNAKVPVVVTNSGSALKGNITVNIYADAGTTLDGNQVLVASMTKKNVSLKTGKKLSVNFSIKSLPATLPAGTYYLLAEVVDPSGTTNVTATTQTVQVIAPFVSLDVAFASVPANVLKLGATLSITNGGNVADTGKFTATVGFSEDAGGDSIIGTSSATSPKPAKLTIKPGKSGKLHVTGWGALFKSLPTTGVPYFLWVQITDGSGNTASAVSTGEIG